MRKKKKDTSQAYTEKQTKQQLSVISISHEVHILKVILLCFRWTIRKEKTSAKLTQKSKKKQQLSIMIISYDVHIIKVILPRFKQTMRKKKEKKKEKTWIKPIPTSKSSSYL